MKRKLLFAIVALLCSVATWAYQTPTADGIYYIQNVNTGKFLCRGNAWGTRAVVSDFGSAWKLVEDNGKFHVRVASLVGASVNQGIGDDYWMYADCSGDRDRTYTLTLISDGQYTMTGSGISMNVYAYTKDDADKFSVAGNATLNDNMTSIDQSYWRFLSQSEYDAVIAGRISTQESAVATSAGYDLSTLDKTLAELVGDVNSFANKGVQATVTATTGWTWTPETNRNGGTGTGSNLVEAFKSPGKFTKTITGLTEGIYKVSVPALFRESNNEACYSLHESGFEPSGGCYISANGNTTSVSSWASGATNNSDPDNMAQAKARIDAGAYSNELYCYVDDSGNLNLEVGVPGWYEVAQWVGSWFIMGDATATLYSDAVSLDDAAAIISTATTLEGEEMNADLLSALSSAKSSFDGARTIANYNALQTAIVAAQASADAYALFAPERTKALALGLTSEAIAALAPNVNALKVAEYNFVNTNYAYGVALGEWTSTGTNTSAATFNNEHWSGTTHDYKNQNDTGGQGWNANSWSINFSQNVTLPAGSYVFKVAGRQASGDKVTTSLVVKKGEEVLGTVNDFPRSNNSRGINTSGATDFATGEGHTYANNGNGYGWEWRYVKFTLAEEATVNIAVNSVATAIHQWVSFGDYTLQADNDDVVDILAYNVAKASAITVRDDAQYVNVTGSEKTALINAINADPTSDYPAATTALDNARVAFTSAKSTYDAWVGATITKNTTNVGTGVFQLNETTNNTLYAAYETARDHEITSSTTAATVAGWTEGVNTAISNYQNQPLNAPDAEKRYKLALADRGTLSFDATGAADEGGYGLPFATAADYMAQTFFLTQTTGNNYKISFVDFDGNTRYACTGENAKGGLGNARIRTTTDASKALVIAISATTTANVFNMLNTADSNNKIGSDGGGMYTANDYTSWSIAEASQASVTVSCKAGKYGTVIFPFTPDVSEGFDDITFYSCGSVNNTTNKVQISEVSEPQANTPYLIYNADGDNFSKTLTDWGTASASDYTAGLLTGVYTYAPITKDANNYVLQTQSGNQAFYYVTENDFESTPYKAYLTYENSEVKSFGFEIIDGSETAIELVQNLDSKVQNSVIYNLAGQRVQKAQKGLYIVNGKKVVIK